MKFQLPLKINNKTIESKKTNWFSSLASFSRTKKRKFFLIVALIILISIILAILVSVTQNISFKDSAGTVWQKYDGSKISLFKVYQEQSGIKTIGYINNECDPQLPLSAITKLKREKLNYRNGIDRPNHCRIIAGYYKGLSSDNAYVNTFILLPDGSLLTLDGGQPSIIQVNIKDNETRIVQSSGNVYYRIAKQTNGKKFVIQTGSQEFTALGTKVFSSINNDIVKLGLYEGAGTLTEYTRNAESIQLQVGKFAEYSYKEIEQLQVDKLISIGVDNLLNSGGFFYKQLVNDKANKIDNIHNMTFGQIQGLMPEVVNIEEDRMMRELEAKLEANNQKWDAVGDEIKAEIEANNQKIENRANQRVKNRANYQSTPSNSTGSTGSTAGTGSSQQCFSKSSQSLSYGICIKNGGAVSGGKCCL